MIVSDHCIFESVAGLEIIQVMFALQENTLITLESSFILHLLRREFLTFFNGV